MVSPRVAIIALLTGLSLLIQIDDAVPQACATKQTTSDVINFISTGYSTIAWDWRSTGAFDLNCRQSDVLQSRLQ
jgi:hypothetical protein